MKGVTILKYLHLTFSMQIMTKTPNAKMRICLMTGAMKFPLLYDSVLEAEYTSMMLIMQRKKNTIQMTLSPLNMLPIVLLLISLFLFFVFLSSFLLLLDF